MANSNLTNAKRAKNDEFYTQYPDIEKEIQAYLDFNPKVFSNKTVYCNCDDPYESNFFRYFVLNFDKLGLKRLITTSYKPSPVANTQLELFGDNKTLPKQKGRPKVNANKFIINEVGDIDGDGDFDLQDIAKQLKDNKNNEWEPLKENGDFKSKECVELLKQSDIVITNPPFSLFRDYVKQLVDFNKKFLIIGSMNAITYKEIFPLIKDNKMWLGTSMDGRNKWFQVPDNYPIRENVANFKIEDGKKFLFVKGCVWFTNLDHGRRHQSLPLMKKQEIIKFVIKKPFDKYDNYNAIEVSLVKNIPSDYNGVMGVPISFLNKYNPDQFEILGSDAYDKTPATKKYTNKVKIVNGKRMKSKTGTMGCVIKRNDYGVGTYFDVGYPVQAVYKRIFIKDKKVKR
jgi:hypothetical protein